MLVTIAVLALAILVLTRMQILSVRGSGFNKESTAALLLAQRVVEDCKGTAFGTMPKSCETASEGMTVACSSEITGNAPFRSNNITVNVLWGRPKKQIGLSTTIAEK